jgi:hypothetical protein
MQLMGVVMTLIRTQRARTSSAIESIGIRRRLPLMLIVGMLIACQSAQAEERGAAAVSVGAVGLLLAGRYDNSAQVARSRETKENPPLQHVIISIEPTQQMDWELWRVHMDVDAAVAQSAGSDTSLDAVWAMSIVPVARDNSFDLIPYSLKPSVDGTTVQASALDQAQWFSLEACALHGNFRQSHMVAQMAADEMCVAATMGLGGKRAFLPARVEREGDWLHVQLIYFGKPWRVDARRVSIPKE